MVGEFLDKLIPQPIKVRLEARKEKEQGAFESAIKAFSDRIAPVEEELREDPIKVIIFGYPHQATKNGRYERKTLQDDVEFFMKDGALHIKLIDYTSEEHFPPVTRKEAPKYYAHAGGRKIIGEKNVGGVFQFRKYSTPLSTGDDKNFFEELGEPVTKINDKTKIIKNLTTFINSHERVNSND